MRSKIILIAIFATLILVSHTLAYEQGECVNAQVTQISPVNLEANQDFIVGIEIDNCGDSNPGNITFEITKYSPDVMIKESLAIEIGELGYSNSKRFITYHMRTIANPTPGEHVFEAKLTYGKGGALFSKDYSFSVNVISQIPEISLSGIKTSPEIINPNQDLILTLKVQNSGEGVAKNVRVKIENIDFEGVKESYLGEIESNQELPARFVLRASDYGDKEYVVKIYYEFADESNMVEFPANLHVFEKNSNIVYYIGALALGVLIMIVIVIRKSFWGKKDESD